MNRILIPALAASLAFAAGDSAMAQRPSQPKTGAAAIVEGVVREVFRSPRRNQVDYLVQIDVRRSELGRGAVDSRRLLIPAPGDPVYVHITQTGTGDGQTVPTERSSIRAYLYPRAQGGWDGASPDWFESSNEPFANRGGDEPAPPADNEGRPTPAPTSSERGSILQTLGFRAEQVNAGGRLVLKVTEVAPDSPAKKAGFEKGDVVIGANGQGFTSLEQLADLLRKGGPVGQLVVLNVQNGQQATVKIEVPGAAAAEPRVGSRPDDAPAAEPKRSLGVRVETKRLGLRTALEVTEVQPGGAAQQAGIEKGDILVEAEGVALTDPTQLQKTIDNSGSSITIKVRDSRTGKDVPVEVRLGAASPTRPGGIPSPAPVDPAPSTGSLTTRSFGITTEAATADLLPVVKVVAVASGSLADKAGIEVGDAITGIDDKVVFAPDLLDEALGKVGSTFTLTVLDVKTGKKTPVKVSRGN